MTVEEKMKELHKKRIELLKKLEAMNRRMTHLAMIENILNKELEEVM